MSSEDLPTVYLQNKIPMILFVKAQPVYLHLKNVEDKAIDSYTEVI